MKSCNKNPKDYHQSSSLIYSLPGCGSPSLSKSPSLSVQESFSTSCQLRPHNFCHALIWSILSILCGVGRHIFFLVLICLPRALPSYSRSFSSHVRTTFSKPDVYCFNFIIWTSSFLYFEFYLIFVLFV